jgi:diguanylate cyclase (GGDEF)-like protein
MNEDLIQQLCRVYPIKCPACNTDNRFPRFKRDIYRAKTSEADGHPLGLSWSGDAEVPQWVTPLTYFWATCQNCHFTDQLEDAGFRQWSKNAKKFLAQYRDGALASVAAGAKAGKGTLHALSEGFQLADPFGAPLTQFYMGIFCECLKASPAAGNLARYYLRIAWIYRDEQNVYGEFAEHSRVRDVLSAAAEPWAAELPPNDDYPVVPGIVTDEVGALRHALAYFEWNFVSLHEAGHDDEIRLMMLIGEIGYRIYLLSGLEEDFKKGQSLFSGAMQKCLAVINDKTIVGGAVNRAKDSLEKAGDRGRELRELHERRAKGKDLPAAPAATGPLKPAAKAASEGNGSDGAAEVEGKPDTREQPPAKPKAAEAPAAGAAASGVVQTLQDKISKMDEENKRWMRLAGISELTGLPNRVMVSRVLLPGAIKEAISRREPLGCILVSPEGMRDINGKHGREVGDLVLKKLSECLKGLLRRGERLAHLDGINFLVIVPTVPHHQLRKRAEALYKELTSRRFELGEAAISLNVCMGVAGLTGVGKKDPPKLLQETLYARAFKALDTAKVKGNQIEVNDEQSVPA